MDASKYALKWEDAPDFLKPQEAAKLMRIGRNRIYEYAAMPDFPKLLIRGDAYGNLGRTIWFSPGNRRSYRPIKQVNPAIKSPWMKCTSSGSGCITLKPCIYYI